MKISLKLDKLPNFKKYKQAYLDQIKKLWQDAIRAFVSKIVLEDIVKVDTGMSRASLLPMARAVKFFMSIIPKRHRGGYSISAGEAAGKQGTKIQYGTLKNPMYFFEFEITVLQYLLQELGLGRGNKSGAWLSLAKGQEAFNNYIRVHGQKYFHVPSYPLGGIS